MKLIHLSDLHLGKRVNEFSMIEDQKYILNEILRIIDKEEPDGILLAGDLYDRPVPSAEAVQLFDRFLTRLAKRKLPVYAISGNHDSAERIAFGSQIMSSSDDTYPAEFAAEMCSKVLEKGTDMVVGDRLSSTYFTENKRPFHNFGNSIVRGSINRLFKSNIKDIMTGYRAMSYRFVKTFPVLSRNFEIETEMTIHAIDKNMQVENVVIEYRDRPEGSESKLNTYADGFKVLKTIVKMFKNYKPLEFFSLIAAVLFVVGMVFFIPVLVHFLEVGTVEKIPTLIVSGFVILTAIICWFSGIILSTLVNQHKQDFEYQTQMVTNRYKDLFPEKK